MQTKTPASRTMFSRLSRIGGWLIGIVFLLLVGYFIAQSGLIGGGASPSIGGPPAGFSAEGTTEVTTEEATVAIRPSTEGIGLVSAAGNLELAAEQQVVVKVNGIVDSIAVNVGDEVAAGDLLLVLDAQDAEQTVQQALLDLSSAQVGLDNTLAGATDAEITAAEATLRSAQATLADVQDGASSQEIAAAQAAVTAAQATYTDVVAPQTADQLTQLEADLRQAEVAVAEAQTAYDQVAWQNSAGMTSQAADLQDATITYEKAQAAYGEATAPAANGDVQSAVSTIESAQQTLADLLAQPSEADIASAEAEVASAEQSLQDLLDGAEASDVESARVALAQAELDIAAAAIDLGNTEVRAPMNGTILSVELQVGQQASEGEVAFTLADTSNLQLTVNVAEMDVKQLTVGMSATVTIDALPGESFAGQVLRISPASDPDQSVVNYPVTVLLVDDDLTGVRAGMTAVAEMQSTSLADTWLAPSSAVQEIDGQPQMVVLRDDNQMTVSVTTGQVQGEWIVVESSELQEGDEVIADLATYTADDNSGFGPPGGGGGGPGGP